MTKAEHYRKAEEHLDFANQVEADVDGWMGDQTRYHLAAAQVHATLAQAAATAGKHDPGKPAVRPSIPRRVR